MSALKVGFVEKGRTIEVKADLKQGWDKELNTYAFRREDRLEYKNSIVLRVSVGVYPRPGGLGPKQELFPAALSSSGPTPIDFELVDCVLTLRIPLIREGVNINLPWDRTKNGKDGFWWNGFDIGSHEQMDYTAQLLVVVHSGVRTCGPIDWVKGEKGVLSGQFESNRRRH